MNSKKIYMGLSWFAIIATPLAPVFFFGNKIYVAIDQFSGIWGHWFVATSIGVVSAIGLELIGILAGHTCIEQAKERKILPAFVSGVILLSYTFIGIRELQGTIGAVLYLIAPMVYVLVGMESVIGEHSKAQVESKQYTREMQKRQQQLDHQLKLERLRTKASMEVAKAKISQQELAREQAEQKREQNEPAREQIIVCSCGREFDTVQAKNAHTRFCEARQNGVAKGVTGQ